MYCRWPARSCDWGLGDGQVVGDSGAEALLGFAKGFVGEVDVGLGGVDEPGGGLDVKDAVADVGVDLLRLVRETSGSLLVRGGGDLFLAAGLGDLEDWDPGSLQLRCRCCGSGRGWCRGRRSRR